MEKKFYNTYSELYAILELLGNTYKEKLPPKILNEIANKKNPEYIPKYDITQNINLSQDTKAIIALLKLNYWCNSELEKANLLKKFNNNEKLIKPAYSVDELFKKRKSKTYIEKNTSITQCKKGFISMLIEKIQNMFLKKN